MAGPDPRPDAARRDLTRPDPLAAVQQTLRRQALQAALRAVAAPPPDSGLPDSGLPDSGLPDPGLPDPGLPDPGLPDPGLPDPGAPDSGAPDSGAPNSGTPNPAILVSRPDRLSAPAPAPATAAPDRAGRETPVTDGPPAGGRLRALGRRGFRRGLRLFRPLLLPLLHRAEWRIRTAVDKSYFATGATARLEELRVRAGGLESRLDRAAERLDARADALAHQLAVDGGETRRMVAETAEAVRSAAATSAAATAEAATRLVAEAAAYQAVLVGQLAEANRLIAALARQHEAAQTAAGNLAAQAAHVVRQNDHNQTVLEAMRAETSRHDAAMAGHMDILLRRGVVPLGGDANAAGDYLVRTPAGWLVVPGGDERLLMAMVEGGGVLERGTTAVLTALLRPGDTMIDVGAHIGTMTLPAARAVGPSGRVIAVEPGPAALAALRRSLHINSLAERVVLHGCAAGAAAGAAVLRLSPVLGENSLVPPVEETAAETAAEKAGEPRGERGRERGGERGGEGRDGGDAASIPVAVRPLDALVPPELARRETLRLVKIDAEGFELEVWKGMRRLLAGAPGLAVIVEFGPSHLARAGIAEADWFAALTAPGFSPWEIDEASGAIRALRPPAARAALFSTNLLLLRRPPEAYPGLRVAGGDGAAPG